MIDDTVDRFIKIEPTELFKLIVASMTQNANCFRLHGLKAEELEAQRKAILNEACLLTKQIKDNEEEVKHYLYPFLS